MRLPVHVRQVIHERLVHGLIDGRVLYGRVGEDQGRWVLQLRRVLGRIGHKVVVGVAVERIELAGIGAGVLLGGCGHGGARQECQGK